MDRFEAQTAEYKESVLPKAVTKRFAIEMGATFGWHRYVGLEGDVLGIDTFGASAPGEKIMEEYGFTVENVVRKVKNALMISEKSLRHGEVFYVNEFFDRKSFYLSQSDNHCKFSYI